MKSEPLFIQWATKRKSLTCTTSAIFGILHTKSAGDASVATQFIPYLSEKSHFENLIFDKIRIFKDSFFHKIRIFKVSCFTKFTISNSHFLHNSPKSHFSTKFTFFNHQILVNFWIKSRGLSHCVAFIRFRT